MLRIIHCYRHSRLLFSLLFMMLYTTSNLYSVHEITLDIHHLIRECNTYDVQMQLSIHPGSLYRLDRAHNTVLHTAVISNKVTLALSIVESDPSLLKAQNIYGWTPLHSACAEGNLEMVKFLLSVDKHNQAIAMVTAQMLTPVLLARLHKKWEIADYLEQYLVSICCRRN